MAGIIKLSELVKGTRKPTAGSSHVRLQAAERLLSKMRDRQSEELRPPASITILSLEPEIVDKEEDEDEVA